MAKISLSKIAPIKTVEAKIITIADQEITVEQYLPVNDKLAIVERVLDAVIDDTGYMNPVRLSIFTNLEIIKTYTNISITDKMMENAAKTYDTLIMNGILDAVIAAIPDEEYNELFDAIVDSGEHVIKYLNSFAGMMKTITADYKNTEMNVDKLMADLGDPEKIGLVKDILDKIG